VELQAVADQVLEEPANLGFVGVNRGEVPDHDAAPILGDPCFQVRDDLGDNGSERDGLLESVQLARDL
jgi:hypothetical protein